MIDTEETIARLQAQNAIMACALRQICGAQNWNSATEFTTRLRNIARIALYDCNRLNRSKDESA